MKNILLLVFMFFVVSTFAQNNEINLSYQWKKSETYGKSASLSYFRNITNKQAFGVKAQFQGFATDSYYKLYTGSIDMVNRWNLSKSKKFRFMIEAGVSAMRKFNHQYQYNSVNSFLFCGFIDPSLPAPISHFSEYWTKTNHFGLSTGLGIDVLIFNSVLFGMDYGLKRYFLSDDSEIDEEVEYLSNLSIKLGLKF